MGVLVTTIENSSNFQRVRALEHETDGEVFVPAHQALYFTGTWTDTRNAEGNYMKRKTAADSTSQIAICLSEILFGKISTDPLPARVRTSRSMRGVRITAIDLVYAIATANMDAHTYDISQATHANNTAVALDDTVGGTLSGTLATATQASPYLSTITLGTPLIVGANTTRTSLWLEVTVDTAATTVYDFYGAYVRFDYNIL